MGPAINSINKNGSEAPKYDGEFIKIDNQGNEIKMYYSKGKPVNWREYKKIRVRDKIDI